jgi:D-inositol-3-phosphate glycosyltransferase
MQKNQIKPITSLTDGLLLPYPITPNRAPKRQAIALISEHGDPAAEIGKEAAGGQNVYVRQVGEALAKLGWQVDMFTRWSDISLPQIVQHGPHCRTIRLKAGPVEYVPRDLLLPYMDEFAAALLAFQAKEGTNYPLVHTNYWMSGLVGLKLQASHNVQLIHTYHSLGAVKYLTTGGDNPIAQTRLSVERQLLLDSDCVVATSPEEEKDLRTLVSAEGGSVKVVPCGTDISNFHTIPKADARQQLGFAKDDRLVLYVGRFDPRKGIETLVRAFSRLSPADSNGKLRLLIVGGSDPNMEDGKERQRIEALVSELGIEASVNFVGLVGHDRLPLYYTAADVCVVPSHYEPFGLVAIEAMACGTPIVASDVGGLKFTVIDRETGLLVPACDEVAFADAISRILSDDIWVQKLRKNATRRVRDNFSWSGVAVQLSDLYRRSLASSFMPSTRIVSTSVPARRVAVPVANRAS